MNAEPRILRTKAEETLAAEYRSVRERLPGNGAARTRRDAAFALFERAGLPHRRVEAWKYTDLRSLMRTVLGFGSGMVRSTSSRGPPALGT